MTGDDIELRALLEAIRATGEATATEPDVVHLRRRRRLRLAILTTAGCIAVSVVGLLGVVVHAALPNSHPARGGVPPAVATEQRVGGTGTVATRGDHVWFCPAPILRPLTVRPQPAECGKAAFMLRNFDVRQLTVRGAAESRAYVEGTLDGQTLTVIKQGPPRQGFGGGSARWTNPPCGKQRWTDGGPDGRRLEAARAEGNSHVVAITIFHPDRAKQVAVVASDRPGATRAALAGATQNVCVVRSQFSRAEVAAAYARAAALARNGDDYVFGVGESADRLGQPIVEVSVLVVSSGARNDFSRFPSGLVAFRPWLRTVR